MYEYYNEFVEEKTWLLTNEKVLCEDNSESDTIQLSNYQKLLGGQLFNPKVNMFILGRTRHILCNGEFDLLEVKELFNKKNIQENVKEAKIIEFLLLCTSMPYDRILSSKDDYRTSSNTLYSRKFYSASQKAVIDIHSLFNNILDIKACYERILPIFNSTGKRKFVEFINREDALWRRLYESVDENNSNDKLDLHKFELQIPNKRKKKMLENDSKKQDESKAGEVNHKWLTQICIRNAEMYQDFVCYLNGNRNTENSGLVNNITKFLNNISNYSIYNYDRDEKRTYNVKRIYGKIEFPFAKVIKDHVKMFDELLISKFVKSDLLVTNDPLYVASINDIVTLLFVNKETKKIASLRSLISRKAMTQELKRVVLGALQEVETSESGDVTKDSVIEALVERIDYFQDRDSLILALDVNEKVKMASEEAKILLKNAEKAIKEAIIKASKAMHNFESSFKKATDAKNGIKNAENLVAKEQKRLDSAEKAYITAQQKVEDQERRVKELMENIDANELSIESEMSVLDGLKQKLKNIQNYALGEFDRIKFEDVKMQIKEAEVKVDGLKKERNSLSSNLKKESNKLNELKNSLLMSDVFRENTKRAFDSAVENAEKTEEVAETLADEAENAKKLLDAAEEAKAIAVKAEEELKNIAAKLEDKVGKLSKIVARIDIEELNNPNSSDDADEDSDDDAPADDAPVDNGNANNE